MIASDDSARHEEAWLSLPWLANGRLSQAERDKIEPHVRTCAACREDYAGETVLHQLLSALHRGVFEAGDEPFGGAHFQGGLAQHGG